jgi:hypothetical protein
MVTTDQLLEAEVVELAELTHLHQIELAEREPMVR